MPRARPAKRGVLAPVNGDVDEPPKKRGRGKSASIAVKPEPESDDDVPLANIAASSKAAPKGRKPKAAVTATKVKSEPVDDATPSTSTAAPNKRKSSRTASAKASAKIKEENNDGIDEMIKDHEKSTKKSQNEKNAKKLQNKKSQSVPEPPKKEAVERVLVKKGNAAVDSLCPIASKSHIYEADGVVWDCMLNQTNIQFNNNKYYLIQLLEDDKGGSYSVWMRWGRVGAPGQNCLKPCGGSLPQAQQIFTKKFSDKTRNDWENKENFEKVPGKYDLLLMDYSHDDADDYSHDDADDKNEEKQSQSTDEVDSKKEKKKVESQLEEQVRALVELICDIKVMEEAVLEMKYDAKKAPLGKLTKEQIKAGYLALVEISNIINGTSKYSRKDLLQACNDFYTRVPHYFGMRVPPLIQTPQEVKEKLELLEALGDIQAAMSFLNSVELGCDMHPTDRHYTGLKCDIKTLQRDSETFQLLNKYVQLNHGKTHGTYNLEVENIFECVKTEEDGRFKKYLGNRMLLWHGSRLSNWAGILSQGLRIAPPEAPVTGYMFGKGIYFADMCSKSANYCMATRRNTTGLLVLCEVALGKVNELQNAKYDAHKLPSGCHSVKGLGSIAPIPANFVTLEDGVVVPLGPGKDVRKASSLLYNEYIVYDVAQVKLRYLVKVNFNFVR